MQTKSIKNSQNKDIHIYQIPLFVDSYFLNTQTIIIALPLIRFLFLRLIAK